MTAVDRNLKAHFSLPLNVGAWSLAEMLAAQDQAIRDGAFAVDLLRALEAAQYDDLRYGPEGERQLSKGWEAVTAAAFLQENQL